MTLSPTTLFDLQHPIAQQIFADHKNVWDVIPDLGRLTLELTQNKQTILGNVHPTVVLGDNPIYIAKTAKVDPHCYIEGPAYIGEGVTVRHGAYVRANVILLDGAILGHSSEAKNALFLPNAHAPHFNYVGDSILGSNVNLGAGTKLSNLGMMSEKDMATGKRPSIKILIDDQLCDIGFAKMGAIMGDNSQTGCNSVLNPGTIIGKNTLIYANCSVRKGYYPAQSILKLRQVQETVERK